MIEEPIAGSGRNLHDDKWKVLCSGHVAEVARESRHCLRLATARNGGVRANALVKANLAVLTNVRVNESAFNCVYY